LLRKEEMGKKERSRKRSAMKRSLEKYGFPSQSELKETPSPEITSKKKKEKLGPYTNSTAYPAAKKREGRENMGGGLAQTRCETASVPKIFHVGGGEIQGAARRTIPKNTIRQKTNEGKSAAARLLPRVRVGIPKEYA